MFVSRRRYVLESLQIAKAGIERERRAWRIGCSPLFHRPGLQDVLQQRHQALELVREGGQVFRRITWGGVSFP